MNKSVKRVRLSSSQDLFTLDESPNKRKRDKKANAKAAKRQQSFKQHSQDDLIFEDVFMTAMERAPVSVN